MWAPSPPGWGAPGVRVVTHLGERPFKVVVLGRLFLGRQPRGLGLGCRRRRFGLGLSRLAGLGLRFEGRCFGRRCSLHSQRRLVLNIVILLLLVASVLALVLVFVLTFAGRCLVVVNVFIGVFLVAVGLRL